MYLARKNCAPALACQADLEQNESGSGDNQASILPRGQAIKSFLINSVEHKIKRDSS